MDLVLGGGEAHCSGFSWLLMSDRVRRRCVGCAQSIHIQATQVSVPVPLLTLLTTRSVVNWPALLAPLLPVRQWPLPSVLSLDSEHGATYGSAVEAVRDAPGRLQPYSDQYQSRRVAWDRQWCGHHSTHTHSGTCGSDWEISRTSKRFTCTTKKTTQHSGQT
jgi:hypothetical protein